MRLTVYKPVKTTSEYTFSLVRDSPFSLRRVIRVLTGNVNSRGYRETFRGRELKFGFTADNFEIPHHRVWDSFYPLFYLTRKGGPIFERAEQATIRFKYPIHIDIRDFFIARARNMGVEITIQADTYSGRFDLATKGHVLSFGGGKESRLVLGMLRELNLSPIPVTAGRNNAKGVDEALTVSNMGHDVMGRIVPALMLLPEFHYMGHIAVVAMRTEPWHRYYDIVSPVALKEMSDMFKGLGINITMSSPTTVLTHSLTQLIVYRRYPELFKNQVSVSPNDKSQKNLHVTLCKMKHDIPYSEQCSDELFKELVADFVEQQHREPNNFEFRDCMKFVVFEIRSMISELKHRPLFAEVRDRVPDEWKMSWFDYIHGYIDPDLPSAFMDIYREYAKDITECPAEEAYFLDT